MVVRLPASSFGNGDDNGDDGYVQQGHLAQIYYDSGRTLSIETLKAKYPLLLAEGKELAQKYTAQITQQSQHLQGAGLSSLLKGVI